MSRKDAVQINARVSSDDASRFDELSSVLGTSKTETFLWLLDLLRYLPADQFQWFLGESKARGVYPGKLLADLIAEARARRNAIAHGVQKLTKAEAKKATDALIDALDLSFLE